MTSFETDIEYLKNRIEDLEKEQGIKIPVDKENLANLGIEDIGRIAAAYGVSLQKLFNP